MNHDVRLSDDLIGRMLRRRSRRGDLLGLDGVIASAIEAMPQRRAAWWSPRSWGTHGELRIVAFATGAVAVIIVATALGIGLLNAEPDPGIGPSSPSPSARPSATPRATEPRTARPLSAGSHTAGFFRPQLTFAVPNGFAVDGDAPRFFGLLPDPTLAGDGGTFLNVFRDLSVAVDDCREASDDTIGNSATEIIGALAARPGLTVSEPATVSVGGLPGQQIDLTISGGWTGTCPEVSGPFVPLVYEAGLLWWGAAEGERFRFIVLDIPGDDAGTVTIITYASDVATWDGHLPVYMQIIESFEFDATAAEPASFGTCGNGAASCGGALAAGDHRTMVFEPSFSYRTPAGWGNPIDIEGVFEIFARLPAITSNPYIEVLSNVSMVGPDAACPTGPDARRGTSVEDWVEYLVSHPSLDVSTPIPVTIGGANGASIDLSIRDGAGELCPAFPPESTGLFFIWSNDLGQPATFGIGPGEMMRLAILDVRGTTVLIASYGPHRSTTQAFSEAIAELQPFVDSIEFDVAR